MTESSHRRRVAVLFGGRSGEHEVSLASARSVMETLDPERYDVVQIGITPEGRWLTTGNPHRQLVAAVAGASPGDGVDASEIEHELITREQGEAEAAVLTQVHRPTRGALLATVDVVFPVLHGPFGEDGTIQGLLEVANLPYVGAGVAASAVGMDKALMKAVFAAAGLPQLPYRVLLRSEWEVSGDRGRWLERLESALNYPMFVKPANLGSSVGVSKVNRRDQLAEALDFAARYDRKLVIEQGLPGAREIELAVLGNDEPQASVAGEIRPLGSHEFYDYEAKYTPGETALMIPADLPPETVAELQSLALRGYRAIDGAGLARADFLVDPVTLEIYINELNTMPGFTATSMYPKLWEASGLSYPDLIDRLIELALERHADRARNQISRGGD